MPATLGSETPCALEAGVLADDGGLDGSNEPANLGKLF